MRTQSNFDAVADAAEKCTEATLNLSGSPPAPSFLPDAVLSRRGLSAESEIGYETHSGRIARSSEKVATCNSVRIEILKGPRNKSPNLIQAPRSVSGEYFVVS